MHLKNAADVPMQTNRDFKQHSQELIGHEAGGSTAYSLSTITLRAGEKSRLHRHPANDETYYVVSGQGKIRVGDETGAVSAGHAAAIPRNTAHQMINESHGDLVFLVITVPAWTPDCSVFLD